MAENERKSWAQSQAELNNTTLYPEPNTSNIWGEVMLEGDGVPNTGLIANTLDKVNDYAEFLGDRATWKNPMTWPGFIGGTLLEGITDAPNEYMQGRDVTYGDAALFGIEAFPGAKMATTAAKRGVGHLAMPQDITRRNKAFENPEDIPAWYRGGKLQQLAKMPHRALRDMTARLWDTEADALYRKHGISPSQKEEFLKQIDFASTNPHSVTNNNEIVSQLQYLDTISQKHFPGNTGFFNDVKKYLFPKTIQTQGSDLLESGLPVKNILDSDLPTPVVTNHMTKPMVDKLGLDGKGIRLNTKVWNDASPLRTLMNQSNRGSSPVKGLDYKYHGNRGEYSPAATVLKLWKMMPDDVPVTMDSLVAQAKAYNSKVLDDLVKIGDKVNDVTLNKSGVPRRNAADTAARRAQKERDSYLTWNPLINIDELVRGTTKADGYLSFPSRVTGEDRLLANFDLRLVIKEGSNEGHMFTYDEMKLGAQKTLDKVLNAGTDEFIAVDLTPITKKGVFVSGQSAAKQQRGATLSQTSEALRGVLQGRFNTSSTLGDRAKTAAKTSSLLMGAEGILDYATTDN